MVWRVAARSHGDGSRVAPQGLGNEHVGCAPEAAALLHEAARKGLRARGGVHG